MFKRLAENNSLLRTGYKLAMGAQAKYNAERNDRFWEF